MARKYRKTLKPVYFTMWLVHDIHAAVYRREPA